MTQKKSSFESIIYVLANKPFYEVKEPGYKTVFFNFETDSLTSLSWCEYKTILQAIQAQNDAPYLGICLSEYYFISNNRLLSMDGLINLLGQYNAIFPEQMNTSTPMMLIQKNWLDQYVEWINQSDENQAFLPLWIQKQNATLFYMPGQKIDTNRMPQMYQLFDDLTKDLVKDYLSHDYLPLTPLPSADIPKGVTPVWVCWWQGYDQMPEVVRLCLQSIETAFSNFPAQIILVTKENYQNYVTFSDAVKMRMKENAIPLTHLSDVLRAQLLCRYGGIWLDATCLIWDNRFIDLLLQYPFFTRKQGGPMNELDIVSGRWATYFVRGLPNLPIFHFWVDAFDLYWEKYDTLQNYFIFDYITAIAYDKLPEVRAFFDAVPVNNEAAQVLESWSNKAYDASRLKLLTDNSWLFKMTYKKEFLSHLPNGEPTLYQMVKEHVETTT